jgi:hypothetical protein
MSKFPRKGEATEAAKAERLPTACRSSVGASPPLTEKGADPRSVVRASLNEDR